MKPLAEAGYFKHPPSPVISDQYISFPIWEQSQYLARMARIPDAQSTVLDIAESIPETENVRVHEDLLDIAVALPPQASARFVPGIIKWIKSPYKLTIPYKLRELIPHLANGGQAHAALALTAEALAPQPDPRLEERKDNQFYTPEPGAWFDDYYYQDIVSRIVTPLVQAAGIEAVALLNNLLEQAIELTRKPNDDGDEDYIYISQEDLTTGPRFDRLPNVLLCATRRAAEEAVALAPKNFELIVSDLRSRRWVTFRRLILHLCRTFPALSKQETAFQLADIEVLNHPSTQLEAKILLRDSFGHLPTSVRDSILEWIERGPDRDWVGQILGSSPTSQDIDEYCNRWRRDRLALLDENLSPEWHQRLGELVASLGQPRAPQPRVRFSGFFRGPASPRSTDDLLALSPMQVVTYLHDWQPKGGFFEPTMEGLGLTLMKVVAERSEEYSKSAEEFKGLDPTYVRAFFHGLWDARKHDRGLDWGPVIELATWVMRQPIEIRRPSYEGLDRDPDWGWTRKAVVDLLEESLCDEPNCLQMEHRDAVMSIIWSLTDDPDPTPQREAEHGGSNMDPAQMAINSVRGDAFNCLIRYAIWVRRAIEKTLPEPERTNLSFDCMPEVREILNSHLDVAVEPSLTVRSIYGRWLSSIAALDHDWTVSSLPRVFPEAESEFPLLLAAWESFVVYNDPNPDLLPVLLPQYRSAISRLSKVPSLMKQPATPEDRLAEHLAIYYWHDYLQLDDKDGLLQQFFVSAPARVRGHLIWYLGSVVSSEKNISSAVFDRLRRLFESRVAAGQNSDSQAEFNEELSRFGLWFTSERFGDQWSLAMLQVVLDLVGEVDLEMTVGERLVALAPRFPLECVKVLATMVERAKEPWLILAIRDSTKEVVRIARAGDNPDARFSATRLAEELVARQHFEFRDVL